MVYVFTIWIIGVLTVLCLTNDRSYFEKNYSFVWISLLVGISEFFIFWCCCCRNVNLIEIGVPATGLSGVIVIEFCEKLIPATFAA